MEKETASKLNGMMSSKEKQISCMHIQWKLIASINVRWLSDASI